MKEILFKKEKTEGLREDQA